MSDRISFVRHGHIALFFKSPATNAVDSLYKALAFNFHEWSFSLRNQTADGTEDCVDNCISLLAGIARCCDDFSIMIVYSRALRSHVVRLRT